MLSVVILMDVSEIDSDKPRRLCSIALWLLAAGVALSVAMIAFVLADGWGSVQRYGFPLNASINNLLSIVAMIGVLLLADRMVRRIKAGNPPFSEENAHCFQLMAVIVFAKFVLSLLVQFFMYGSNPGLRQDIFFSPDALIACMVLAAFYYTFKYGTTLQNEVQDLV